MGLVLGTALAALSPAPAGAKQAIFGYNDRSLFVTDKQSEITQLTRETGAGAYRMTLEWHSIEPAPGIWQWEQFDARYRQVLRTGMRPVMVLRSAPEWANTDATACTSALFHKECVLPPDRGHLSNFSEFGRRAAARYPEAIGFEIWNEPNLSQEWRPAADPRYFVDVLRAGRDGIKRGDAKALVVAGGIGPIDPHIVPGVNLDGYLRIMYQAGARGLMDAIGIHPYSYPFDPAPPDSFYRNLMGSLKHIRNENGDSKTPFWITEFGYHTGSGTAGGVPPADQARYLASIVRQAIHDPDVDVALAAFARRLRRRPLLPLERLRARRPAIPAEAVARGSRARRPPAHGRDERADLDPLEVPEAEEAGEGQEEAQEVHRRRQRLGAHLEARHRDGDAVGEEPPRVQGAAHDERRERRGQDLGPHPAQGHEARPLHAHGARGRPVREPVGHGAAQDPDPVEPAP